MINQEWETKIHLYQQAKAGTIITANPEGKELIRAEQQFMVEAKKRAFVDPEAFRPVYDKYVAPVFSYVSLRVEGPHIEDVVAEVFMGALKNKYEPRGETPPIAWLFAIAQKRILHHRKEWHKKPTDSLDEFLNKTSLGDGAEIKKTVPKALISPDSAFQQAEEKDRTRMITIALKSLPDSQGEVVLLRYVYELSIEDTAGITGKTPGAVKQLSLRGLETLNKILTSLKVEPI